MPLTRRTFIALTTAAAIGQRFLTPTPACADDHDPTPAQTAGPYFKPESPERSNFITEGIEGKKLVVRGTVLDTEGNPLPKALLDFWHANADGEYDNEGFNLRGHLYAGDDGTYKLVTIVPKAYPGRTAHIHVRVQKPGGEVLTTQLYFPDNPLNEKDGIYNKALDMAMTEKENRTVGKFDFVLGA